MALIDFSKTEQPKQVDWSQYDGSGVYKLNNLNRKINEYSTAYTNATKGITELGKGWTDSGKTSTYLSSMSDVENRAYSIRNDLLQNAESYKKVLGDKKYNDLLNNITKDYSSAQETMKKARTVSELYSKYKDKDSYDADVRTYGYQNKYKGITTYQQANDFLNSQDYKSQRESGKISDEENNWFSNFAYSLMTSKDAETEIQNIDSATRMYDQKVKEYKILINNARAYAGRENEYKEKTTQLKQEIDQMFALKERKKLLEGIKDTAKRIENTDNYNNLQFESDFDQQSKAGSAIKNSTMEEILTWEANADDPTLNLNQGKEPPKIINKVEFYFKNRSSYEDAAISSNAPQSDWVDVLRMGYHQSWSYMTGAERKTYSYILEKSGEKVADKYLNDMEVVWTKRQRDAENQQISEAIQNNGFLGDVAASAVAVPASVFGGISAYLDNSIRQISGKEINPYSSAQTGRIFSDTVTGNISQKIENSSDFKILGQNVLSQLYSTAMSILNTTLGTAVMGKFYSVAAGSSAAASQAAALYERGASNSQIFWGGTLTGLAEMVFEYISIDRLLKAKNPDSVLSLVIEGLKQGGVESTEEMSTEIANILTDCMIMGDNSEVNQLIKEYEANGNSRNEAIKQMIYDKIGQVVWSGVGGFLSGEIMGSFGAGFEYVTDRDTRSLGKTLLTSQTIIDDFKEMASGMNLDEKLSGAVADLNLKTPPVKAGQIFSGVLKSAQESSKQQIVDALKSNGKSEKSAEFLAEKIINLGLKVDTSDKIDSDISDLTLDDAVKPIFNDFAYNGEYGGKALKDVAEFFSDEHFQKAWAAEQDRNSVNQNPVDNAEDKLVVTEMLSDDTLQNVVAYQQENGNNVPLHVLGTNKGSTLYKALKSAGMINADGTVNAAALVNAYQQRSDNQNSGLQGAVKDGIINNKTNAVRSDENGGTNADILAGRGVSTSGRSQNRVRTYGANTEIIRGELENLYSSEGNDVNVLAAGESAWLSTRDFEPAQEVGGGLEKNFLRNIQGVKSNGYDSVGRILSPELQEKVSDTVFMEEDGTVFSFFHWTPNQFDEFKYGDGAFHCGTLTAAITVKHRSDQKVDGYIKEMYVISKNPFILKDEGEFGAYAVAMQLEEYGIIDHKDVLRISKMDGFYSDRYDAEANVYVRGILESLGYDSYLYQNLYEDGCKWSVGVFHADQIITIAENGVLKENCGVTEADSNDGSAFNLDKNADDKNNSNSEDVNADSDVQSDNYAKDDKYWQAENKNQDDSVPKGLLQKIKELFSKNSGESNTSLGEIVKLIEKTFNIPISTGKFHQKAYGIYKNKSEAIRTKVSNALPTIAHEVGHHLDKKYGLRSLPSIDEAIQVLKDTRPDFFNSYTVKQRPAEAVAEFIRDYLADRTLAKNKYPKFYQEFESKLNATSNKDSKIDGAKDLQNLKTIGDLINKYYTAEKVDRARSAVVSRAEAKRRNRNFADLKTKLKTHLYDDGAVLKEVSDEAHDLFDYAKKGVVRSHNTLVGDYMAGFDGDLVQQLDKDGNPVKEENGDPVYVPALTKLFDDIRTKDELVDFKMYLIYKHGLEFLSNNKRVFADDTINNKEFMSEQIAAMEEKYPQFKDIAESVYEWQRTFMYEYGVKSGLMSEQTAKALWQKYPCYIPFNRNVEGAIKSFGKRGLANQNAAIRSAKGSGLDMCDPIENIALKVEEFMKAADRNAVMQEIANTADQEGGFGYMLEQVPPDMSPTTVSAEKTKQTIDQLLKENLSQTDATKIYEVLDNAIGDVITDFQINSKQSGNVVWVYRNGKKTYYQVHDSNLLQALIGLNKKQFDIVTKGFGKVTRLFKALTTGGNAVWSLTSNSVRDFSSAYKYSVEKNPIKFTVDYVKAIGNVMSQIGDSKGKRTSEYLKLYRTLGGGYNSSVVNTQQLKSTVKSIVSLDKTMPQKVAHSFNILHRIETLADAVETAPRLAEFKRVLEKTGDKRQALKAAEEITVNFNRSGTTGKWIDQWIPYFNASIQGTTKFIDNLLHNQVFRTKTIISGILKVALLFAWNMIAMGDDDNDEYEKLSAYKKNNFYNIYKGNGEFISIPKAKDVAYFDSIVERIFEMAFKEDVDWAQEVQDFAAYTWLVFAPPLFITEDKKTDVVIFSTFSDLLSNTDFKGTPIVPSAYDDLLPEYQYNENTTWIAYGIGQMFGLSPMQIDHIIDSNFGWLGLLNRSLGKMSGEKDWSLGVGTKTVTDNTYSTDILNHFYDHAETANKTANSRPDDGDAVAKNKQYAAAKSVISALNAYGKDDADSARDYRILSRDYADNFEKNTVGSTDKRLIQLYERCNNADIFADKTFNREYSIDKVKYTMDSDLYLDYVDEYYAKINELYDDILDLGASDEMTVIMLVQAKQEVTDLLNEKYKPGDEEPKDFSSNWKNSVVNEMGDNIQRKSKSGEITYSEQREYNRYLKSLK